MGIPECIPAFHPVNTGTDPSFPSDPRTALNSSNEEMNVLMDQSQGRKAGAEIKKNNNKIKQNAGFSSRASGDDGRQQRKLPVKEAEG